MSAAVQAMFLFQGFQSDNRELPCDHTRVSDAYVNVEKWVGLLACACDFCWQLSDGPYPYFECEVSEKFGHWLRDNKKAPIETGVREIISLVRICLEGKQKLTDQEISRLSRDMYAAAAKKF